MHFASESNALRSRINLEISGMNDFSDKLSYTRLGSIGNKDAYNFISSPVEISPNDDSNIEVQSDYMYNMPSKKKSILDNKYTKGAISVGTISFIVLLALVINIIFRKEY